MSEIGAVPCATCGKVVPGQVRIPYQDKRYCISCYLAARNQQTPEQWKSVQRERRKWGLL